MQDYVLNEEMSRIRRVINGKVLSVIFDGTSRRGEALAIVLQFVTDDWK